MFASDLFRHLLTNTITTTDPSQITSHIIRHSQWLGVVQHVVGRPRPREYPRHEGLGRRRVAPLMPRDAPCHPVADVPGIVVVPVATTAALPGRTEAGPRCSRPIRCAARRAARLVEAVLVVLLVVRCGQSRKRPGFSDMRGSG